jgi:mono/diheme cytochrome c family protein
MRTRAVAFLFLLGCALPVPARQTKPNSSIMLNDTQVLGRRLFQQRCAVCHTESTPGARKYGPDLYKEVVDGNEETMRALIANGSKGKMPGFKYGLEAPEIDAIVEYLKTVPRPAKRTGSAQEGGVD